MVCSQCGQTVPEGATLCPVCGQLSPVTNEGMARSAQPPAGVDGPAAEKTSGLAIASLICGILFLFFPLSIGLSSSDTFRYRKSRKVRAA